MCGFVGFTGSVGDAERVIESMMDAIRHRGPDASGRYVDADIALGHRRLSIIDISEQGNQPLYSEDDNLVLVFNGEIYNYREIRKELQKLGYRFRTQTDSEVLIYGYAAYGTKLLEKLRGMFSFVIWDKRKKTLFGARDFFGIKPLYYAKMGDTLLFGSEIKAFLKHPHFQKELNTAALEQYLTFQYSAMEETFFKNVFRLQPAHYFLWKDGKLDIHRYWDVQFDADGNPSLDDWVQQISGVFHDSVEAHKIADVEVGSFLSSGVDSSYVAAVADVDKTFTVGFGEDERYNEIGWAKDFSKAIGKQHFTKVITPEEYWASLRHIQYYMDEPLADPSAVALYFVCGLASQQLKVVLSVNEEWPNARKIYPLMKAYPGISLCLSEQVWMGAIEDMVDKFGSERLLYSSSYPVRYPGGTVMMVQAANITEEDKCVRCIDFVNAITLGVRCDINLRTCTVTVFCRCEDKCITKCRCTIVD